MKNIVKLLLVTAISLALNSQSILKDVMKKGV